LRIIKSRLKRARVPCLPQFYGLPALRVVRGDTHERDVRELAIELQQENGQAALLTLSGTSARVACAAWSP
jgi:hypothetical protein